MSAMPLHFLNDGYAIKPTDAGLIASLQQQGYVCVFQESPQDQPREPVLAGGLLGQSETGD